MSVATARVLDGKALAETVRADVSESVRELSMTSSRPPGLATILVGDDPASAAYVASKRRACAEVGIRSIHHALPAKVSRDELRDLVQVLNEDPEVSGILCQLPLPEHLDGTEISNLISPSKDVDGLTVASAGRLALGLPGLRPCTPSGVMLLLESAKVELRGALTVVLGRSNLFGKPMGQLLLAADATVVACHSRTRDAAALCRQADVLIAAVGRPAMVGASWVKPGAAVIDVGINRTDDGLAGDVDFDDVAAIAGAITPVPGGVGPMTIACLLRNTLRAERGLSGK